MSFVSGEVPESIFLYIIFSVSNRLAVPTALHSYTDQIHSAAP
jgi:hypothetical protein